MVTLEGKSAFFLCKDYAGKGPRVVLLCGRRWTDAMLRHYGIFDAPFFVRERRETEPERMPNGHPWGWVYKVEDVVKDEQRWLDPQTLDSFQSALQQVLLNNQMAIGKQ